MGNSKKAKVIGFASFALGAMLFALSYSAEAQQPEKVPHITELAYLPPGEPRSAGVWGG